MTWNSKNVGVEAVNIVINVRKKIMMKEKAQDIVIGMIRCFKNNGTNWSK